MKPLEYKYLKPAVVVQNQNHVYSEFYHDIYFNSDNGLKETEYVFLAGNNLTTKWTQKHQQSVFCIAETGFGSGLNFLTTCLAWQKSELKPKHLHFISTELHPLTTEHLRQIHQQFPQLDEFSQQLLNQYGSMRTGFHHMKISDDITLMLLLGDVVDTLKELVADVDAWFLDGFAPSRNPQMWTTALFNQMARLSKQGATFATFSAAAVVKNGLSEAGFTVQKVKGFGRKRDMLVGHYSGPSVRKLNKQPWHPLSPQINGDHAVTILGGGIAGMCLARSFHQIGFHTTLIDHHQKPMQQASGHGYAMVMPYITAKGSKEALFYLRAFESAKKTYGDDFFHPIGVREWLQNTAQLKRAQTIDALNFPKDLVNVADRYICYPHAGYVDTYALTQSWLHHVDRWIPAAVDALKKHSDCWQLFDSNGQLVHQCKTLIVAAGISSNKLIEAQNLALTAKLGQTNQLITDKPLPFKDVQLHEGYIIPITTNSQHCLIGATFDHIDFEKISANSHNHLNHLERNLRTWQESTFYSTLTTAELLSSHTAIRATTPDHLPLCGPVVEESQFKIDYKDLHHGRHWQQYPDAPVAENLYVMTGLGSRGFTSAPLLAEYLMSMITGQPLPLEADLCKIIHPNRFNYRQLKKGT